MSPEEFQLNSIIDGKTNVFNMGAIAFALLGGGQDRSFIKWEAGERLCEVAYRAVNENRSKRYASMEEFNNAWLKVYNTEKL
ncbi:Protein of unknown function [Bacillus mycoides]|nr:Protein of unknown function [Bacillus mycoides]